MSKILNTLFTIVIVGAIPAHAEAQSYYMRSKLNVETTATPSPPHVKTSTCGAFALDEGPSYVDAYDVIASNVPNLQAALAACQGGDINKDGCIAFQDYVNQPFTVYAVYGGSGQMPAPGYAYSKCLTM